jgi:hypothetical protein
MKVKPNNSNPHQSYLELYQKDKLMELLPFFTPYKKDFFPIIEIMKQTLGSVS